MRLDKKTVTCKFVSKLIAIFVPSNTMATRRLQTDLRKIRKDPPPGISADISNDDIFEWDAVIFGPGDTPFEGGTFRLKLEFPPNYPSKPPVAFFHSRMFHPNVYPNGKICLDILEKPEKWDPIYDAAAVLCSIQSMLGDPNPDSPANGEANQLFVENPELYERRVRQLVAMAENEEGDGNLNQEDIAVDVSSRLDQLDLSGVEGDPDLIREFLKS